MAYLRHSNIQSLNESSRSNRHKRTIASYVSLFKVPLSLENTINDVVISPHGATALTKRVVKEIKSSVNLRIIFLMHLQILTSNIKSKCKADGENLYFETRIVRVHKSFTKIPVLSTATPVDDFTLLTRPALFLALIETKYVCP